MATTCKLIAKNVLGSAASNIEFTSIPGTYTDLLLVASVRTSSNGGELDNAYLTFNGSTSGYSERLLYSHGSSALSSSRTSQADFAWPIVSVGSTATSSTFSNAEVYIPNYAGSTNKSISATSVGENNATSAQIYVDAGVWANTAAITSMKIQASGSNTLATGSSFFLYGITKS